MCWLARAKKWCTVRGRISQRLEQPLDHRAKHFLHLEVEGWPRQARVAPVQQCGAEFVQAMDGPLQQSADDGLCGSVTGQFVQVALYDGRGAFLVHVASS